MKAKGKPNKILGHRKEGVALVSSLGLISAMSVLSLSLMATALTEFRSAERFENRIFLFHLADGAIDQTIARLRTNRSYSGVPLTTASNGRVTARYRTTVTPSLSRPNTFTISSFSILGANTYSYGYQEKRLVAVVQMPVRTPGNFTVFSDERVKLKGSARVDAYDSREGPYTAGRATNDAHLGTNATARRKVTLVGNARIGGDVTVGPNGNPLSVIQLRGNARILGTRSAARSRTALDPVSSCSNPRTLRINRSGTVTLAAGDHCFSSITVGGNARLEIRGPVDVYVRGNVRIQGGAVINSRSNPSNFRLFVKGPGSVGVNGSARYHGVIHAPRSHVSIRGRGQVFGSIAARKFKMTSSSKLHYDKALREATSGGARGGNELKAWTEAW